MGGECDEWGGVGSTSSGSVARGMGLGVGGGVMMGGGEGEGLEGDGDSGGSEDWGVGAELSSGVSCMAYQWPTKKKGRVGVGVYWDLRLYGLIDFENSRYWLTQVCLLIGGSGEDCCLYGMCRGGGDR